MMPLIVGNWKMNGDMASSSQLARQTARLLKKHSPAVEVALAPPFTALNTVARALRTSAVKLAAQNCHWAESGAFTGEVSAAMLGDIGCHLIIIGHSERRHLFNENDETIARKTAAVLERDLRPILCVGETLEQRQRDETLQVITSQLHGALKGSAKGVIDKLEIAYEPVWAIGTGHNATAAQVAQVHRNIRDYITNSFGEDQGKAVRILYGGSVKPENTAMLAAIEEVNGLLVGGASLNAESFVSIAEIFSATAKK